MLGELWQTFLDLIYLIKVHQTARVHFSLWEQKISHKTITVKKYFILPIGSNSFR